LTPSPPKAQRFEPSLGIAVTDKQGYDGQFVTELDAFLDRLDTPIHSLYAITRDHADGRVKELAAILLVMWNDEYERQKPNAEPPPAA
jgi:hypothetical protein